MADDERDQRLLEIRQAKQDRLDILNEQIARLGAMHAPPHMLVEQRQLRKELLAECGQLRAEFEMVEAVIKAPAGIGIGDELGEGGRFILYHQMWKQVQDELALLGKRHDESGQVLHALVERFEDFVGGSTEWRTQMRQWLTWIGIAIFVLSLVAVAVITYLATRGV